MSFSYLRDKARNYDKALWNCAEFKRADFSQCMKLQVLVPVTRQADSFKLESLTGTTKVAAPPVTSTIKPIPELSGVRRKADSAAPPTRPLSLPPAPATQPPGR